MKKLLAALVASIVLSTAACQSIEAAKVDGATIASSGDAVAVIQATALGFSLLFHFVMITEASLDTVVNKMMVGEAKALGGNKIQLVGLMELPKHGIFAIGGGLFFPFGIPPFAQASGIAVR